MFSNIYFYITFAFMKISFYIKMLLTYNVDQILDLKFWLRLRLSLRSQKMYQNTSNIDNDVEITYEIL